EQELGNDPAAVVIPYHPRFQLGQEVGWLFFTATPAQREVAAADAPESLGLQHQRAGDGSGERLILELARIQALNASRASRQCAPSLGLIRSAQNEAAFVQRNENEAPQPRARIAAQPA